MFPFLKKYFLSALLVAMIFGAATFAGVKKFVSPYFRATSFFTVTFEHTPPEPYYVAQYADWFTESLRGWIETDDFAEKLRTEFAQNNLPNLHPEILRTTHLNLTVNFRATDWDSGKKANEIFMKLFSKEVESYNHGLENKLIIAAPRTSVVAVEVGDRKIPAATGAVLGFILALIFFLARDFSRGVLWSLGGAEDLFGEAPLAIFCARDRDGIARFVKNFLGHLGQHGRADLLEFGEKSLWSGSLLFPRDSARLPAMKNEVVFALRLGETTSFEIRQALELYGEGAAWILVS